MPSNLKVGDKVRALRSHNKAIAVEGEITSIDGNAVTLKLSGAGVPHNVRPVEHEAHETVHADDVTLIERPTQRAAPTK